jgi:hypothetical protein
MENSLEELAYTRQSNPPGFSPGGGKSEALTPHFCWVPDESQHGEKPLQKIKIRADSCSDISGLREATELFYTQLRRTPAWERVVLWA